MGNWGQTPAPSPFAKGSRAVPSHIIPLWDIVPLGITSALYKIIHRIFPEFPVDSIMTPLQKGFSHREEAKTTKISKKKFRNPKSFFGIFSFCFAVIKISSRPPWHRPPGQVSLLRGKKSVFPVDSIMLLDPAKPKHFILLRHLNKISQTFLEFFGTFARPINKGDPNPLVGI